MSDLVAKLGVDATAWNTGFQKAKGTLSSFGSGIGSMFSPIGAAVAGVGATLAGVWGAASSANAFKDSLEAQRKLSAVIEATGGAAGVTTSEITAFASEMQTLTNFEDDATTAAAAALAAFTNIRGQTFKDTITSAMDLSTVMGGDLQDNVKLLGKALNDPIDGVKKLAKAGVQLTQAQEQEVEALQKSGDMLGAQTILLDAVRERFGGAAEAVSDPWTRLTNIVGDVSENIGAVLLPTINVVSEAVGQWLAPIASSGDAFLDLGTTIAANVETAIGLVSQFGTTLAEYVTYGVEVASDAFAFFLESVGLGGVTFQNAASAVMVYYSHASEIFDLLVTGFQLTMVQIGAEAMHLFTEVAPAYISWFADNWYEILITIAANTLTTFENIGTNIKNVWTSVLEFFRTGKFEFNWQPLTDGFINTVKELPQIADREIGPLEQTLKDAFDIKSTNLGESMAAQFAEIEVKTAQTKEKLVKEFSTDSKVPAGSITDPAEGKDHSKGKDPTNGAALITSAEAAKMATAGIGATMLDVAKQQLAVSKKSDVRLGNISRNTSKDPPPGKAIK